MPQGYQEWDAAGNLIVDITTNVARVLGVATLTGGTDGSLTDADLLTGTPFVQCVFLNSYAGYMPTFTVSGSTLSWAWGGRGSGSYRLIYGVT